MDTERLVLCRNCKHPADSHTDIGCGFRMLDPDNRDEKGRQLTKICNCLKFQEPKARE